VAADVPVPAAGLAMEPTSVTVMGASTRQRKFGEPLFPAGTASPTGPADQTPAPAVESTSAVGGVVARPTSAAGWLVVAGGVIAGISFLLPWADAVLGGSSADESYLGHWGLANPPNILLLLGSLGIAWLAVLPTHRLVWLRTIGLPIVAGGLLLGVTWPYILGPYGPRLGMWLTVIGAGLLVAGGIAALFEASTKRDRNGCEAESDAESA
jgi:hypothetical protein